MAFRVIYIENEISIKIKLNNLIITKGIQDDIWIPMSDISMIVIDNLSTNISIRTLYALSEQGIGVVICDTKHHPAGIYSPIANHSRAPKILGYQIRFHQTEATDILWKEIVIHKIDNQRKVLQKLDYIEQAKHLLDMINNVEEGDPTNREAHAAKVYFNTIMNNSFSRGNEDILLNSGLDYGYAIIRAYIARVAVAYGLNTQIGIHHKNEYNKFNLCDDLIEPLRPFVDWYAYNLLKDECIFSANHRHCLVNILNHKVLYKNKKMYLCNVIEEYVSSYQSFIAGERREIVFPDIENYIGEEDEL